jgi:hypothetical protein
MATRTHPQARKLPMARAQPRPRWPVLHTHEGEGVGVSRMVGHAHWAQLAKLSRMNLPVCRRLGPGTANFVANLDLVLCRSAVSFAAFICGKLRINGQLEFPKKNRGKKFGNQKCHIG